MSESEEGPDCEKDEGIANEGEGNGKGRRRERRRGRKNKEGKGQKESKGEGKKDKLPANQVVKPGDWTCPNCSNNVWASKDVCAMCQEPKPQPGGGKGGGRGDFGRGRPPQQFAPVDSFSRWAAAVRLPPAELTEWEHDLRRPLLDVLGYLNGPLPLVEWINRRLGGELETFFDESGAVLVRLRPGAFVQPAPGPPPTDLKNKKDLRKDLKNLPDDQRRDTFFEKLPSDSFNNSEIKLRAMIFEFLASWQSTKKATLLDMMDNENVERVRGQFIPKVVTLQEWVERRMGEEILFRKDRAGSDIVDVTPLGQEGVNDTIEDLAAKRRGEGDNNPQGGKKQKT